MAEQVCEDCGFFYTENSMGKCYKLKRTNASAVGSACTSFIIRQYDGDEPYTPEEHGWLLRDLQGRKKLSTGIQGMHL